MTASEISKVQALTRSGLPTRVIANILREERGVDGYAVRDKDVSNAQLKYRQEQSQCRLSIEASCDDPEEIRKMLLQDIKNMSHEQLLEIKEAVVKMKLAAANPEIPNSSDRSTKSPLTLELPDKKKTRCSNPFNIEPIRLVD